jgi:hypothetical protein
MSKFACLNDEDDEIVEQTRDNPTKPTGTTGIQANHTDAQNIPLQHKAEQQMFEKYYKKGNRSQPNGSGRQFSSTTSSQPTKTLTLVEKPFDINDEIQCPLKILAHHIIDITKWDISNFHYVTTLRTWIDIPKFISALKFDSGISSILDYDLYIMKEHITPLWENAWNRNGSICSIRIDNLQEAIGLIGKLMLHMCNNSLLLNGVDSFNNVNGISFTPKKISSVSSQQMNYYLIKIWLRTNYYGQSPDRILCADIMAIIKKLSVKITPIKAEY